MKAAAAVALLVVTAAPGAAQQAVVLRPVELLPGVTVMHGPPNGNVLIVRTEAGLVLVDAQSAGPAVTLDSLVALRGAVRLVITTHYHEDHLGGNARFRARGAPVLAHANVPRLAARDTTVTEFDWHLEPAPAAALPTRLVEGDSTFTVGGTTIVVRHYAGAHTAGDLTVWLPAARVLHTGDIYEVGAYPFIDVWAGGSVDGMIRAVTDMLASAPPGTTVVPGHGRPTSLAELEDYRDMLVQVRDTVAALLAGGASEEEVIAAGVTAPWDEARGGERAGRFFAFQVTRSLRGVAP